MFSQIDPIDAYHQMRIREQDCHETATRARFRSFEWGVVCLSLTNARATFSRLLCSLLRDRNADFYKLFLDDVLVYSQSVM